MFDQEIVPFLNTYLETLDQSKISKALKYSIEGGKCIRGFIVKHILETLNPNNLSWEPIVAVELIQAASLIIDDLPSMDNDAIRRGKPSTFKMFGEHESILTSFFMVSESLRIMNTKIFELTESNTDSKVAIKSLIDEWCSLLGRNLVVGQMIDLKGDCEDMFNIKLSNKEEINETLIKYKTCSLFSFAFVLGALFADKNLDTEEFKQMGYFFGLMFQLMDDFKDKETDDVFANYILAKGEVKAREKYTEARTSLLLLLAKNNILTDRFKELITLIDSKFISKPMLEAN
jgi:geranylgeranyl diphosphate synthase type II